LGRGGMAMQMARERAVWSGGREAGSGSRGGWAAGDRAEGLGDGGVRIVRPWGSLGGGEGGRGAAGTAQEVGAEGGGMGALGDERGGPEQERGAGAGGSDRTHWVAHRRRGRPMGRMEAGEVAPSAGAPERGYGCHGAAGAKAGNPP